MGWERHRFIDQERIVHDIICFICAKVAEEPIQAPCEHIFCTKCINQWFEEGHVSCPVDDCLLTPRDLKLPHRLTMQLINNLIIRCKNFPKGCQLMSKLEDIAQLVKHEEKRCPFSQELDLDAVKNEINGLKVICSELNEEINIRAMAIQDKNESLEEKEDRIKNLKNDIEETERVQQRIWKAFLLKLDRLSNMARLNTIKDSATISVHNTTKPKSNDNACKLSHICVSDHTSGGAHSFASPKCLKGTHTMLVDSARGFSCDICFSKKEKQPGWQCDECDDDFCFSCYPI